MIVVAGMVVQELVSGGKLLIARSNELPFKELGMQQKRWTVQNSLKAHPRTTSRCSFECTTKYCRKTSQGAAKTE